jgi:hypothetical protein
MSDDSDDVDTVSEMKDSFRTHPRRHFPDQGLMPLMLKISDFCAVSLMLMIMNWCVASLMTDKL